MQNRNQGIISGTVVKRETFGEGRDKFHLVAVGYEQFRDPFEFYLRKELYDQIPEAGSFVELHFELEAKSTVANGRDGNSRAKTIIRPVVKRIVAAGAATDGEARPRRMAA